MKGKNGDVIGWGGGNSTRLRKTTSVRAREPAFLLRAQNMKGVV